MTQEESNSIPVWSNEQMGNEKSALPKISRKVADATQVSTEVLSNNLREFVQKFQGAIDPDVDIGGFCIEELELSLVVNAKGGIELLGKVEAGAQASLKIKLRKRAKD